MRLLLFVLFATVAMGQTITCNPANCAAGAGGTVVLTASASVSWAMAAHTVGTISPATGTTATYTAPATIANAQSSIGGCMVAPNDSVWEQRIDGLPVNTNSASWLANVGSYFQFQSGWDINVVDSTANTVASPKFYYSTQLNGLPFLFNNNPSRARENGALIANVYGLDHHMISVNHQNCNFYESYPDYDPIQNVSMGQVSPSNPCVNPTDSSGCDSNGGAHYTSANYALSAPTTDAANLLLSPLTPRASEIRAGAIKHAFRMTTNAAGCNGTSIWPATGNPGCSTAGAMPAGARFRMKSSATCPLSTVEGTIVCTALKQYGVFWADLGSGSPPDIIIAEDNYYDPYAALGYQMTIPNSSFEAVDESSLQIGTTGSYAVNPIPTTEAVVNSALVSVNSGAKYVSIALQPVTVGFTWPYATVISGAPFTPTPWVNGTATTTVTWTATAGTFSGGVYTPPTVAPGAANATPTLTACSTVTPTACGSLYLTVVPAKCQTADTHTRICIDTGATSNYGPDANGDTWAADAIVSGAQTNLINQGMGWTTQPDGTLYQTWLQPTGDITYTFAGIPQGDYKITAGQGIGYDGSGSACAFYGGFPSTYGPFALEAGPQFQYVVSQGLIVNYHQDPGLPQGAATGNGYECYLRSSFSFPAVVAADGNLVVSMVGPGTPAMGGYYPTSLSTLKVELDSTVPYVQITFNGQDDVVTAGQTMQLASVFWYLPQTALTWTVVSGPGTINSSGLFTAPSSQPTLTSPTVISATDASGNVSNPLVLYVQGAQQPAYVF